MRQVVRIGVDIAKRWFQIHAVDGDDRKVLNRKLEMSLICAPPHMWLRTLALQHRSGVPEPRGKGRRALCRSGHSGSQ